MFVCVWLSALEIGTRIPTSTHSWILLSCCPSPIRIAFVDVKTLLELIELYDVCLIAPRPSAEGRRSQGLMIEVDLNLAYPPFCLCVCFSVRHRSIIISFHCMWVTAVMHCGYIHMVWFDVTESDWFIANRIFDAHLWLFKFRLSIFWLVYCRSNNICSFIGYLRTAEVLLPHTDQLKLNHCCLIVSFDYGQVYSQKYFSPKELCDKIMTENAHICVKMYVEVWGLLHLMYF